MKHKHPHAAAIHRIGYKTIMAHFGISRQAVHKWTVNGVPRRHLKTLKMLGAVAGDPMPELVESEPARARSYPDRPGYRRTDTSKAAADDMIVSAPTIKEGVIAALERVGPLASFELAAILGRSYRSVQPRTSELRAEGKICDSGFRRRDPETGKAAIVWALSPR